ncbi:hypothetical protein [Aquimarina brevivitae]|uniref:Lipoprotein n=1 Tax=Aquimarina brevivitae TaxID=323412 RepID=A0A4Q7PGT0_9FLAO|nr:hypothetical protein [Aquimarina brevivitae]RZS99731.1 hypothetical protein EV197_0955 [Aquimarina brevivitae]
MRGILLFIMLIFLLSCNNRPNKILSKVFENYKDYNFQNKFFESNDYVTPLLIIYKAEMTKDEYYKLINSPKYVPNCNTFKGCRYENMKANSFPFNLSEVNWWQPVYNLNPDFVGHYNAKMDQFTDCETSREYKFAYKFLNGYCYLIIENTLENRRR